VNVHNFQVADGVHPRDSMVVGPDGAFYGTHWLGGAAGCNGGTVFRFDPAVVAYSVLHEFSCLDQSGRNSDGYRSVAPVSFGPDGRLYLTTQAGGTGGNPIRPAVGVLASMRPDGSDYRVEHMFGTVIGPHGGYADGVNPFGGLVWSGTVAYGTVSDGIYRWDGTTATVIYTFSALVRTTLPDGTTTPTNYDGAGCYGSPTMGADGLLYGYTLFGGAWGRGTVFALDPNLDPVTHLAHLTKLYDVPEYTFTGNTDNTPGGTSILASDGAMYLATAYGGARGTGMILRVAPDHTVSVIHEFDTYPYGPGGALSLGTLAEGVADGLLYGTTFYGGNMGGQGTVYRISKDGSQFDVLWAFGPNAHDGTKPGCFNIPGPTWAPDGHLYGLDGLCGTIGGGALWRLDTVSLGAVPIPDVRGDNLTTAGQVLVAAGLTVGQVANVIDRTCNNIGTVSNQNPSPGTPVQPGSAVNLSIGKRPPPPFQCP
jgi:uncharacterized repeat protein (TIGR03803 family)